jgi:hypothetical protein
MRSSHTFTVDSTVFDERNLVSAAGLVPVLELAEMTGLSELIDEYVDLPSARVKFGVVNPMRTGSGSPSTAHGRSGAVHPRFWNGCTCTSARAGNSAG